MVDDIFEVGNKVIREYDVGLCPRGVIGTLIRFSEIYYTRVKNFGHRPGVYVNKKRCYVEMEGSTYHEITGRLELVDKAEEINRLKEWQERRAGFRNWRDEVKYNEEKLFLRELPETAFWEGDRVLVNVRCGLVVISVPDVESVGMLDASLKANLPSPQRNFMVVGIEYCKKHEAKRWTYRISDDFSSPWYTHAEEPDMELIERGNVWKHYHGQKPQFKNVLEEVGFFRMLGHYDEVRNPRNGLFEWTFREGLQAVQEGLIDGFSYDVPPLGKPTMVAIKMLDGDLGERFREATLENFGFNKFS